MTNKEISNIFSKIADILEIKDENVFRIRAYRNAAQNVMSLSRQLKDIYKEDPSNIEKIPGIGKDLKEKIIEMLETGNLAYYDELISEFSPDFLDLLNLSGLGPKKLKKLREQLKIENVNDLEKACKKGKLEGIEGMGKKTEEKLLEAIAHYRTSEGRMLLPEAYEYAEKVVSYLKKSKIFKKIEKAGSLRRAQETVGDLDILAVATDDKKAMDHFVSYPDIENVIAKGPTKSSIKLKKGPQIDLRIVDKSYFGAALIYFTGSKQHNVKIRTIAKSNGFKISEYGIFDVKKKDKFIAGKTEKEVYKTLGMEWIAPELREDDGEIEAAKKGNLPKRLVELKDIKGDLHLHSPESDGRSSIEELAEKATQKGYEYIAITEHSKFSRVARGLDEKRLLKHIEKIRKISKKFKKLKIITGIEVDMLEDGTLDLKDSVLKELDIVIASIHSKFGLNKTKQTDRVLKAIDNKHLNIVGHPSGRLISSRKPIDLDFDKIFKAASEANVYMEINTHGQRIDLNAANCRRAKDFGVKFAICTDSHEVAQLDKILFGVETARRGWVEKKEVLNALSFDKMVKALKRK